jgi:hypothetical protein
MRETAMAKVGFKKVALGTNMGAITFYAVTGLPAGVKWSVLPEDPCRPGGEWYIRAGKRTVRCKSLADAKGKAESMAAAK